MAQLFALLAEIQTNAQRISDELDRSTNKMKEKRQMGQCLQAGIMATPRAGTNELGGSATAVRPAVEAGEDRVIRGTCRTRSVKVTVTQGEKLNGVTETCTRHIETREITNAVTEIKTPETQEIEKVEERLHDKDGVKDERTHGVSKGP